MTLNPLNVYKVRKITRANRLFDDMKYQVIINNTNNYLKLRSWCFRTFGESVEYSMFINRSQINLEPVWSWDSENNQRLKRHLYLKNDQILNMFESNYSSVINQ